MRAVVFMNTKDATVLAGIAVQSQWLGPQDIPQVTAVYDRITGTNPKSHSYGWAQTNSNEVEGDPWNLDVAVQAIKQRFDNAWQAYTRCETGVDRLMVYALAQNGFDSRNFKNPKWPKDPDGNMDWNYFLDRYGKNPLCSECKDSTSYHRLELRKPVHAQNLYAGFAVAIVVGL